MNPSQDRKFAASTPAAERTREALRTLAASPDVRHLSRLSLPQIEAAVVEIDRLFPGQEISSLILHGLLALPGREVSAEAAAGHTDRLLQVWARMKDAAVFTTLFAGPAIVMLAYQNLLKLAGKSAAAAFPQGYWQFYVDYALREDSAHHAHETRGFTALLDRHQIRLARADRLTAWVMAGIQVLHEYEALLTNEWRERVYLAELGRVESERPGRPFGAGRIADDWARRRPYRRGLDVRPGQSYAAYRLRKFDEFIEPHLQRLSDRGKARWLAAVEQRKGEELPRFLRQMSILATLEPGPIEDRRRPISLSEGKIGLVVDGRYYFFPLLREDGAAAPLPPDVTTIRAQIHQILKAPPAGRPAELRPLARLQRAALGEWLPELDQVSGLETAQLRAAPFLINGDEGAAGRPLAEIRQGERGIGLQAVTVFLTAESAVTDLSHLFFDGIWGAAFSEILTNEALAWAVYLNALPPIHPPAPHLRPAVEPLPEPFARRIAALPAAGPEAAAETAAVHLRELLALRRVFKLRSDLVRLTVNDLLLLYRALHTFTYRPDPALVAALEELAGREPAAAEALTAVRAAPAASPTILIPVDASPHAPCDRVYPLAVQVPVRQLALLAHHRQALEALERYRAASGHGGERSALYEAFDKKQRAYLALLAGLGAVLSEIKRGAAAGETSSIEVIKLLGHLPRPVQHLLDQIPNRVDLVNALIKGEEVFSNIGAVAGSSSLTRFLSARDDNEAKERAWGILTDARQTMVITLRDFRPAIRQLIEAGHAGLADRIAADYLDGYAAGLNRYVGELRQITMASRETQISPDLVRPEPGGEQNERP